MGYNQVHTHYPQPTNQVGGFNPSESQIGSSSQLLGKIKVMFQTKPPTSNNIGITSSSSSNPSIHFFSSFQTGDMKWYNVRPPNDPNELTKNNLVNSSVYGVYNYS